MLAIHLLAVALAGPQHWAAEDAAWIITPPELQAWRKLRNDGQRWKFIERFWLRRDPTPDTAANEFRDEHYWRIAEALQRFAARSDESRVFVALGPPDRIDELEPARRVWHYRWVEGIGVDVAVSFEENAGRFRLAMPAAEREALLTVDPALPVTGPDLIVRSSAAPRPLPGLKLHVRRATRLMSSVEIEAALPMQARVSGSIAREQGAVVQQWEREAIAGRAPYRCRVALEAGSYVLTLSAFEPDAKVAYRESRRFRVN